MSGLADEPQLIKATTAASIDEASESWNKLMRLFNAGGSHRTTPPQVVSPDFSLNQVAADRAAGLSTVADLAKDFYTRYPQHTNTNEARKIEVLSLLHAAKNGGDVVDRLEIAARALREDKTIPEALRAQVIGSYEFMWVAQESIRGPDRVAAIEATARKLIKEFPAMPQGYESLLNLAYQSEGFNSRKWVNEILDGTPPVNIAARARAFLARLDLVGKPLVDIFQQANVGEVQNALKSRIPTVIYSWGLKSTARGRFGELLGKLPPSGFNIIGINLDNDVAAAKEFAATHHLPGYLHYGPRAENLRMTGDLLVYLVNDRGIICDVQGAIDLTVKLSSLATKDIK